MRNLAKSKSIQALACCNVVKFLRCIAVFYTVSPSPSSSPFGFATFSTVSQLSHTKVQCEHLNPKTQKPKPKRKPELEAEPETGSRKYSIQSANKQPTISHHLLLGLGTDSSATATAIASTDCSCRAAAAK